MSEKRTVRFGYSAPSNITFKGTYDTRISYEEWAEMTEKEQGEVMADAVYELVEIFELGEDEDDYRGTWR